MTYTIEHSNGRKDSGYETIEAAQEALRAEYPHAEIERDADGTVARDPEDTADYAYLARIYHRAEVV